MNKKEKTINKISELIQIIFGYGIFICLFVGGLTFFAYLAALIIGGDIATNICTFIYKGFYPHLIRLSSTMILLGFVKMYLCKEVALSSKKSK